MHNDQPVFVSVPEFAERVSLSTRAVWSLIAVGAIPALHIGRRRLVPLRAAIEALHALDATHPSRTARQMSI